ncbi:MAG: DUF6785 family protein, partial [Armatimonadota bacterium]
SGLSHGIHKSMPNIPEIPMSFPLHSLFQNPPLNGMHVFFFVVSFSVIGFSYFLPLDVAFSFWFFMLFFKFQDVIRLFMNHQLELMPLYGGTRLYHGYQSVGAFCTIAFMLVYLSRPHLKLVWQRIIGSGAEDIDKNEFMSYRSAAGGIIISMLLVLLFLKAAGMNVLIALFMIIVFVFIVMIVLSRCTAEVGLLMLQPVFRPIDLWAVFSSKATLGANNLTVLSFLNGSFMRDPRNVMPVFFDSMKATDSVNVRRKTMAIGLAVAIVVGAFAAVMIQLWLIYHHGGLNMNSWFFKVSPKLYFEESLATLKGANKFNPQAPIFFTVGAIFTVFLYMMRARFWWWPFHPLGYAMGAAWPSIVYWSSFFIGWLAKSVILRYGGATSYKRFRPFFLGLILGEFASAILWALLTGYFGLLSPAIPIS